MKKKVCQMVLARIHTPQLNIHHVGNPCKRMPVCPFLLRKSECPFDTSQVQSGKHKAVPCYIKVIIKVDKIMILDPIID
jgi:hypothetical protein